MVVDHTYYIVDRKMGSSSESINVAILMVM